MQHQDSAPSNHLKIFLDFWKAGFLEYLARFISSEIISFVVIHRG